MTIKLALLQSRSFPSKAESMAEHERLIAEAAQNGANIICTQELCFTPYFCNDQDPAKFDLAEPVPGPVTERFARLAEQYGVVLILSLFEHRAPGICHNTAAIIDADGTFLGKYRKMHIPQDPGFEEKFYFTPGDLGFRAWQTKFGRIGVIICWDQWYPFTSPAGRRGNPFLSDRNRRHRHRTRIPRETPARRLAQRPDLPLRRKRLLLCRSQPDGRGEWNEILGHLVCLRLLRQPHRRRFAGPGGDPLCGMRPRRNGGTPPYVAVLPGSAHRRLSGHSEEVPR